MPKASPKEFREDVIRVARTGDAPLRQVARDFGIAESCLRRWMRKAEQAENPEARAVMVARRRVGRSFDQDLVAAIVAVMAPPIVTALFFATM